MASQGHSKQPSYFKTLPEDIIRSPAGVSWIPNSRFPTIAPINASTYKSVYERAGFDVYKPPVHQHGRRQAGVQDSRSVSMSQITSPKQPGTKFTQFSNKSDGVFGNSARTNVRSVTSPVQSSLTPLPSPGNTPTDSKFPEATQLKTSPAKDGSEPMQLETPVSTPQNITADDLTTVPLNGTSETFPLSASSSHSPTNNRSSKPVDEDEESHTSTCVYDPEVKSGSVSVTSVKDFKLEDEPSVIETVEDDLNLTSDEDQDEYKTASDDESKDQEDSDDDLNLSDDESYPPSMQSAVLSPLIGRDDVTSDKSLPQSIVSSPKDTQSDLVEPQITQFVNQVPTFDISPPEVEDDFHSYQPPVAKSFNRDSGVSRAASSIYSEAPIISESPDFTFARERITEDGYEDIEDTTTAAFEEVTRELDDLTMSSVSSKLRNSNRTSKDRLSYLSQLQKTTSDLDSVPQSPLFSDIPKRHAESGGLYSRPRERPDDTVINKEEVKYPPGEGPCRKCHLEIIKKRIYSKSGELSGQWHRECFTCTVCDIQFNKQIACFVLDDLPYCEHHYHLTNGSLCQVCDQGIVGQCLEGDNGDRYHVECLKCTGCGRHIDQDYMTVNDKVYCEPCTTAFLNGQGTETLRSNDKIERRRTRLYFI